MLARVIRKLRPSPLPPPRNLKQFRSDHYTRHNARRLEHLASLRIPVAHRTVLEVGAGIGDHSHYYLDRGCSVVITEARAENLDYLRKRFPDGDVRHLDLEAPTELPDGPFDIVHCYGLLYHLGDPQGCLRFLARNTGSMLLLETCVSFGDDERINLVVEDDCPTQAASLAGCRPTRAWVFSRLKELFPYAYATTTQPNHEEFPLDWKAPDLSPTLLHRAVFVGSREPIENEFLSESLSDLQIRHA